MRGSVCEIPEGFHPIPYAVGYFVDELGRVGSSMRGSDFKIMNQKISRDGVRLEMNLRVDKLKRMFPVSRLILDGNLGVLNGNYQTVFLNGNPFDCRLSNLERIPLIPVEDRLEGIAEWISIPCFLKDI